MSSAPGVLIAYLAARTERIRVGAGGVMLPLTRRTRWPSSSPPSRRCTRDASTSGSAGPAPADGPALRLLEAALRRDPGAVAAFPALIDELLGFLHHFGPDRHRFHALPLAPHPVTPPAVHVLGAGEGSARIAAERGLPFAYGHHLSRSVRRPQAAADYRAAFTPDPDRPSNSAPHLIVSVNVVCAETDDEAEDIALRTAVHRIAHPEESGGRVSSLSPVRETYLARKALAEYEVVAGGPATVAAALDTIAAELGADEVMVAPYDLAGPERSRTLRLAATARPGEVGEVGRPATAGPTGAVGRAGAARGTAGREAVARDAAVQDAAGRATAGRETAARP